VAGNNDVRTQRRTVNGRRCVIKYTVDRTQSNRTFFYFFILVLGDDDDDKPFRVWTSQKLDLTVTARCSGALCRPRQIVCIHYSMCRERARSRHGVFVDRLTMALDRCKKQIDVAQKYNWPSMGVDICG